MNTYFTSDLHFGHSNIIRYCARPFKDAHHMNCRLIDEINMRCNPEDTLIHLGDFCTRGNARGVTGVKTKAEEWQDRINCTIIHVIGNHEKNNSVKGMAYGMIVKCAHWWAWCCHFPAYYPEHIPSNIDAIVCGHVHEKWDVLPVSDARNRWGVPLINVGVDVRNFRPVRHTELIHLIKLEKSTT